MEPGDWVALAAAIVALAAMGVTIWQAVEANKSRRAADRQAAAAEDALAEAKEQTAAAKTSAEAAQRSVDAVETQAREARKANDLARQALDHERAARDARDEPQLSVKPVKRAKKLPGRSVVVTLLEGSAVNVALREARARGHSPEIVEIADEGAPPQRLVKGATATFTFQLARVERTTQVELLLDCEEIDGRRRWPKWETVTFYPPPRVYTA